MMIKKPKRILTLSEAGIENAIHCYLEEYGIVEDDTDYSIDINGAGCYTKAEVIIYRKDDKNEPNN